jgi:hypothetical protein
MDYKGADDVQDAFSIIRVHDLEVHEYINAKILGLYIFNNVEKDIYVEVLLLNTIYSCGSCSNISATIFYEMGVCLRKSWLVL